MFLAITKLFAVGVDEAKASDAAFRSTAIRSFGECLLSGGQSQSTVRHAPVDLPRVSATPRNAHLAKRSSELSWNFSSGISSTMSFPSARLTKFLSLSGNSIGMTQASDSHSTNHSRNLGNSIIAISGLWQCLRMT